MRKLLPLLVLLAASAHAQVSTNDRSLDQLPAAKPAAPAASRAPHRKAAKTVAKTAKPAARTSHAAIGTVAVPAAPPANPVIAPPPLVMPQHAPPPRSPVPVRADAPGAPSPIPGGTRIGFGPGTADLNPATLAAIQAISAAALANPAMTVSIAGYAPGSADDPSTPRRVSLDRALAARAVLINAGVPSNRIFALARGTDGVAAGPPDRVDITATAPAAQSAKAPAAAKP